MTTVRIRPARASGHVRAPPSKSYTHRALVAGHLTGRRYAIHDPLDSDDTRATGRALTALGSTLDRGGAVWTVAPHRPERRRSPEIDCGESGTTLRFAAALAARSGEPVRLVGHGRLPERPIVELFDALESLGADCHRPGGRRGLPATVRGPLHGGRVSLDASRSSQFVSALLLTLPTVPGDSELELVGPIVSEPYIDATLAVLRRHRVRWTRHARHFSIPGDQTYHGRSFTVPGDASSAAYLWTAGALTGGSVRVTGIPVDLPQADLAVLDLLTSAGATVRRSRVGATVSGGALRGFSVDLTASPDLFPLAGVLAAAIPDRSELRGAEQIVHKESDRRSGTVRLARALGAEALFDGASLTIRGRARPTRFTVTDLHDHRLVMSAATAALVADGPSTIGDARAVRKSYPGFWSALGALRGGTGS